MKSRFLTLGITLLVFIALYLVGWARFKGFGSTVVLANILYDNAFLGITAVGMTFVILSGGIDLSVGSVIAFVGVFCALMIQNTQLHPLIVFGMALIIGTLFGATMGTIIHYLKIPAFIVTLAGQFLARGLIFLLTTRSVGVTHEFYQQVYDISIKLPSGGRLSFLAMIFLAVLVGGIFIAHFTEFGRDIYAMGGNENAALLLGVPVARTMIGVYALSGFLAALAGVVYSLYTSSGYPLATVGVELDAIAAVVIGGTLLTGGVGYVAGTFIGILINGTIQTYITFDGTLNSWWTRILIGFLLFVFIALQKFLSSSSGQSVFRFARGLRRAEQTAN
ncbi:MAG: sugar ABC transporter permease YjfF [Anaerolineaceae bacterium]|nr:sugar ABC transporter permease YjfF [Anaerolineaceae bacterium]